MKSIKFITTAALVVSVLFSCSKDELGTKIEEPSIEKNSFSNLEITNLSKLGFDPEQTEIVDFILPDNTVEKVYQFEDMSFPVSEINSLSNVETNLVESDEAKLFVSTNRVQGNRTYRIAYVNFDASFQKQAAGDLTFLFNQLGTTVQLRHVFIKGEDFSRTQADIFVFFRRQQSLATAQFPRNNVPGRFMSIDSRDQSINGIDNRVGLRKLLLHEMGHQFGLRHSDFLDRGETISFSDKNNDIPNSIAIPGTDQTGKSRNSVMASGSVKGIQANPAYYTGQDVRAFRYLFGRR